MKVLCSCTPLSGHLFPMLPLACALRDDGHEVVVATGEALGPALDAAGLEHRSCGPHFDHSVGEALGRYPETPLGSPEEQQRFGWGRLFGDVRIRGTIGDLRSAADELAPDVVIHESAELAGPLVAAERDVPSLNVGIGLMVRPDHLALASDAVAPLWAASDLPTRDDAGLYRSLYLNQMPRSLQRARVDELAAVHDLRPTSHGLGERLPEDLSELGTERALVYVTFGTVFGDGALLQQIVDVVAGLDVDVLVTIGDVIDPGAVQGCSRVVVRPFVPQGAVLDRCAAVVSHGGVGSTLGPLAHGVPLVLVPLGADQAENAEALGDAGVAVVVAVEDARGAALERALRWALGDPDAAAAAERVRLEIARMPSPHAVADRLASLVMS